MVTDDDDDDDDDDDEATVGRPLNFPILNYEGPACRAQTISFFGRRLAWRLSPGTCRMAPPVAWHQSPGTPEQSC
jgi:hypothetical protein